MATYIELAEMRTFAISGTVTKISHRKDGSSRVDIEYDGDPVSYSGLRTSSLKVEEGQLLTAGSLIGSYFV